MDIVQSIWYVCGASLLIFFILVATNLDEFKGRFCYICGARLETQWYTNRLTKWLFGFRQFCPNLTCESYEKPTVVSKLINAFEITFVLWILCYVSFFRKAIIEERPESLNILDGLHFVGFLCLVLVFLLEIKQFRMQVRTLEVL